MEADHFPVPQNYIVRCSRPRQSARNVAALVRATPGLCHHSPVDSRTTAAWQSSPSCWQRLQSLTWLKSPTLAALPVL